MKENQRYSYFTSKKVLTFGFPFLSISTVKKNTPNDSLKGRYTTMARTNSEIKVWELSKERANELLNMAKAIIAALVLAGQIVKVSLSKGNRKIGQCLNFSTMPGLTCGNCAACLLVCYAMKALNVYWRTALPAWAKNTYMIKYHPEAVYEQVNLAMQRRRAHFYLRWHVSGEFETMEELDIMFRLARNNPKYEVWTYSKMYALVNKYVAAHGGADCIPENLHIMFSAWGTQAMKCINNPYNFPYYVTVLKGETAPDCYFCPGNCDLCKAEYSNDGKCHGCLRGETTFTYEHN